MKLIPELYGLVLMGGKSQRMGRDKSEIQYHGIPQREYAAGLLSGFTAKTYLSCHPDQVGLVESKYELLSDSFLDLGPLGGILTAFRKHPDKAWLVFAVDLPKMDVVGIKELVTARKPKKLASAFENNETGKPEPLIAIWEPAIFPILLAFLAKDMISPQKILIDLDINQVKLSQSEKLLNVNRPTDL